MPRPGLALLPAHHPALAVNSALVTISTTSHERLEVHAILTVVCFLFAIDRAWELLGESKSGASFLAVGQGAPISSGPWPHQ